MSFASSAFGQLRYIPELVYNTIPGAGNAIDLRMTSPTAKAQLQFAKSQEIRPDRLSTGQTKVDMNIDGGFNFELSGKEYDPFIEAALGGNFAHYGTAGVGTSFTCTTIANKVTAAAAPTGTSAFTGLANGSWFKLNPPAGASQSVKDYFADKWFKVASTTTTEINVDASTPIAAPGLVTAVAGYSVTQSVVSNGAVAKSFAMEYALTDIGMYLTYTGMRSNSFELSMEVGSIITGAFSFIGGGHPEPGGASLLPGTPVASQSLEVMNSVTDVGAIYEGGSNILSGSTSFIKSVKFNLNNNARGQKAIGVFGNAGIGLGELEIGGTLDIYVENANYYNKWLRGTTTNLALGMADAAGNGYMLEMDKVNFTDGGLNPGGRNDDVMLSLPFSAFYNAATGRGLRITRAVAA